MGEETKAILEVGSPRLDVVLMEREEKLITF